ncbi:hypothetical protein EMIT0P4_130009 [Pseudomonas sp. IT-P4]
MRGDLTIPERVSGLILQTLLLIFFSGLRITGKLHGTCGSELGPGSLPQGLYFYRVM